MFDIFIFNCHFSSQKPIFFCMESISFHVHIWTATFLCISLAIQRECIFCCYMQTTNSFSLCFMHKFYLHTKCFPCGYCIKDNVKWCWFTACYSERRWHHFPLYFPQFMLASSISWLPNVQKIFVRLNETCPGWVLRSTKWNVTE